MQMMKPVQNSKRSAAQRLAVAAALSAVLYGAAGCAAAKPATGQLTPQVGLVAFLAEARFEGPVLSGPKDGAMAKYVTNGDHV